MRFLTIQWDLKNPSLRTLFGVLQLMLQECTFFKATNEFFLFQKAESLFFRYFYLFSENVQFFLNNEVRSGSV